MIKIKVGNETRRRLYRLRRELKLSNHNQVIEHLLDNTITLNPDVRKALLEFQKWSHNKTPNHTIVNLLLVFCEKKYKDLERKYFLN